MTRARLTRFEWGCLAVMAAALVLRLTFLLKPGIIWDSAWFLMLSRSFAQTGTFLLRWSAPGQPEYSGYWPPLFPIFLVPFVKVFGPKYTTLVIGSSVASALLVAGVFFTTRDLFDRARAFGAAAMVAATPAFYASDVKGMSESLLALMVVLALWAFVKSIDKPAWMPVAGGFAFLAYLGKANLGLPIVGVLVAALVAWRVRSRGWRRTLRSKWDVGLALAAALALLVLAATRTEQVGGIGGGIIEPVQKATAGAACSHVLASLEATGFMCWLPVFLGKILFVAAFLLVVTLPFSLRLGAALRAPRTERTDAIWLAAILPLVAGAVFTTSFFFTERRNFVDFDNIRYLTPAIVPFLWVLLPHWDFGAASASRDDPLVRRHERWYALAVGSMVALLLLNPFAGTETLPRFVAFLVLALVPVALATAAYSTRYATQERRVGREVETRAVRDVRPAEDRALALGVTGALVLAAALFSSWYAAVGIGLLVALAASSPRARLVGMAAILLASAAPQALSPLPTEPAMEALATFPEGTVVGLGEPVVYTAAVAPDHVRVLRVEPAGAIPPDIDALLLVGEEGAQERAGFTRVATYNYTIWLSPTIGARVWIEETLLGARFQLPEARGLTLYVRDGSGLESYVSRA